MTERADDWVPRGGFGSAGRSGDDPRYADEFDAARTDRYDEGRQADPYGWIAEFDQPSHSRRGPGDPYHKSGYGDQERYGDQGGYGTAGDYRDPGGYVAADGHHPYPDGYAAADGHHPYPTGYRGRGDLGEHRDQGDYGHPASYGDQGDYGSAPTHPDQAYPPAPPAEPYGHAGYGAGGSYDPYGRAPYGDEPYRDQAAYPSHSGATSAYDWPGDRQQTDPHAAQPYSRASSIDDTGSYGRDTGSFGRVADSGSFGRADSGSFGRADSGSFGRDDLRREEISRSARGALPAGSDGYAQWRSDPAESGSWGRRDDADPGDDEWADDDGDDDSPVSRFFTRSGHGDGGDDQGGARRKPRRLRGRLALTVTILACALVLGMVADFGYEYVHKWINHRYGDYPGGGYGTVQVTVPPGSSLSQLGPTLLRDGVIMALRPYDSAANSTASAATLQPGVYQLKHHMSAALAVAALLNPKDRATDQITIIEGWRASRIAATLAKQTGLAASKFTQIIDHPPASLGLPKWAAGKTAEGFLFPDTYTLLPHMSALAILQMMVRDFTRRTASLRLATAASHVFTTPYHVLIVASLIQAEGGSPGDFGKISRVTWNRLKLNMALHFDSTVFFAMHTYGTALTHAQEHYPSPYNTYTHTGLPPGPIDSPGLGAIQAALHAPDGPWLYFITDTRHKPYKTYFTGSYATFQQWQQQFQG